MFMFKVIHYFQLIYLKNFRICACQNYELDPDSITCQAEKNFQMLLMIEKGIRGGICHAIHRYMKASNKYI